MHLDHLRSQSKTIWVSKASRHPHVCWGTIIIYTDQATLGQIQLPSGCGTLGNWTSHGNSMMCSRRRWRISCSWRMRSVERPNSCGHTGQGQATAVCYLKDLFLGHIQAWLLGLANSTANYILDQRDCDISWPHSKFRTRQEIAFKIIQGPIQGNWPIEGLFDHAGEC